MLLLLPAHILPAQPPGERPKIGLTLSGGGAKGLAHIGILKAIDSAGLKVDYITGTSMGSIVGGLYALGYSADTIEKMARNLDWEVLLSNRTSLRSLIMEEKEEYEKYALELQLKDGGPKLPTGVLEGEEMWLKLSEMFAPAYNVTDFNKLSIPFRCIGTEVSTGNAAVLDEGNMVNAIRASMAIPSVFTAVEIDDCVLVDGGIVRNFPVSDVREMGAEYVIGSSVSSGLLPQEKLTDAASILMQVIFLPDGLQHQEQKKLCNLYIEHPVEDKYSAASFGKAKEIIHVGIEQGRLYYPQLKHLADSLNAIYGDPGVTSRRLPEADSVFISSYEVRGLKRTSKTYFTKMMGLRPQRHYNVTQLSHRVRNVFGTRYYNRILYSLVPLPDGTTKVIFDVDENAMTQAKLALHYNSFSDLSLIANLTTRNLFLPASRSLVTLALSENFRARGEHLQQFGRNNKMALLGSVQLETFGFTNYQRFAPIGSQRQTFFKSDLKIQYSTGRKWTIGGGWRYERVKYKPNIESEFDLRGNNNLQSVFAYTAFNTLDASFFPKKGLKMTAEAGHLFQYRAPNLTATFNGEPANNLDSLGIGRNNFQRIVFDAEWYRPLSRRTTLLLQGQVGLNFNYKQFVLNDFALGGLNNQFRNQITFAGLQEATVTTPSVAALLLGLRYEAINNLFVTLRADGAAYNFVSRRTMRMPDFISGVALTAAYSTPFGPVELSAMYSPDSGKVGTYINLGFAF